MSINVGIERNTQIPNMLVYYINDSLCSKITIIYINSVKNIAFAEVFLLINSISLLQ